MEIDLKGHVAIVTGAGRGIGLEIALTLAREGVHTIIADKSEDLLESARVEAEANGLSLSAMACDVTDSAAVKAAVAHVLEKFKRVDILVNNAGVLTPGYVEDLTDQAWDLGFDVNVKGVFLMCREVIPHMKEQRRGRIINAASFAAIVPSIGSASYAASKAAVHYFTRSLAGELGPWNITVNCYAPGMIPTEMNHFADAPTAQQDRLLNTLTLRRWGHPRDVANLVCFLASDLAGYITGTMVDVSGGKFATQFPQAVYEREGLV